MDFILAAKLLFIAYTSVGFTLHKMKFRLYKNVRLQPSIFALCDFQNCYVSKIRIK